jgi:hypothetical protein
MSQLKVLEGTPKSHVGSGAIGHIGTAGADAIPVAIRLVAQKGSTFHHAVAAFWRPLRIASQTVSLSSGPSISVSGRKYVPARIEMVMGPVTPERRCARAASRASASVLIEPWGETAMIWAGGGDDHEEQNHCKTSELPKYILERQHRS